MIAAVDFAEILTVPHVLILVITIYSICLHEAAHAYVADYFSGLRQWIYG